MKSRSKNYDMSTLLASTSQTYSQNCTEGVLLGLNHGIKENHHSPGEILLHVKV